MYLGGRYLNNIERYPWWWRYGRPADIWIKNIDRIGEIIKKNNLKALPEEYSRTIEPIPLETPKIPFKRPPIPGGIRLAHVHFKDEIYILNDEQWKDFTTSVIKDFQARLARAKTVDLQKVIELSEAIDNIL